MNKSIKKKRAEKKAHQESNDLSQKARKKKAISMMMKFASDEEICQATGFMENEILELRKEQRQAHEDYMRKHHGH